MTRRWFMRNLVGAASAIATGVCWMSGRVMPRRVLRAIRLGKYPGRVVPMGDIHKQAKWSG